MTPRTTRIVFVLLGGGWALLFVLCLITHVSAVELWMHGASVVTALLAARAVR